jgi:hypothetical protein
MMAQLAEAGKLTLDDVRELEKAVKDHDLRRRAERRKEERTPRSK